MNTFQAIKKCNKKAWQEIRRIRNANNMLSVEAAINDAVEKTFGFYNRGLLIVKMKRLGQMGELESLMRLRRVNFDQHLGMIRKYLIDMIPHRLTSTRIYKELYC